MAPDRSRFTPIAHECAATKLRTLTRAVTGLYDEALRPLGLRVSQLNVLVAASQIGVARHAHIAALFHLDATTVSRSVDRLVEKGWLEIVDESDDGRAQPFRLTKEGWKLLERARKPWRRAQDEAERLLGEAGLSAISGAVDEVRRRGG